MSGLAAPYRASSPASPASPSGRWIRPRTPFPPSRFIGESATLIAHNGARFDFPFLRETCSRHQLPVRFTQVLDSLALSRKLWGGRGGHGMTRLGLSADGIRRHDARGDVHLLAQAVRQMWTRLDPFFRQCPVPTRQGIIPALLN